MIEESMLTEFDIDRIEPTVVGPGCTRRDLPATDGVRVWVVDIEPGATWPYIDRHDAAGEQMFVLNGELIEGDRVFPAGTYINFHPNSFHQPRSETGVRLLGLNRL